MELRLSHRELLAKQPPWTGKDWRTSCGHDVKDAVPGRVGGVKGGSRRKNIGEIQEDLVPDVRGALAAAGEAQAAERPEREEVLLARKRTRGECL